MFPENLKKHHMDTRMPEKFQVQHANICNNIHAALAE
jgi:hypothetical protein